MSKGFVSIIPCPITNISVIKIYRSAYCNLWGLAVADAFANGRPVAELFHGLLK